jgi:hypothetical protein
MPSARIKESANTTEQRTSVRRHLYHLTKMKTGSGSALRDCLILESPTEECGSISEA